MKCPNCGAEMREGTLYCERCGEDIHIVPDFEPELELNIEKSLEHILEDVAEPETKETEAAAQENLKRVPHLWRWIFLGVLALAAVLGGVKLFQYYSLDYQVSRARQAVAKTQYEKAIRYYTRAMELDRSDVGLKFDLAEVYFLKNNKVEYEYLLTNIVQDPYTDAEQLSSAYGKLIAIYKARGDYQTINDILRGCGDESIRSAYQGYLALPPEFSVPGGHYTSVTALKLTVTGKGRIYYTMDGTDPDENSEQYTAPILLEKGRYTVKALFVNENEVASDVVSAEYYIEAEGLEAPELNVDSGEYNIPVSVTVTNSLENIYYTTDGTAPGIYSQQYTEPIPMPLGVSHFKFVRLEAGQSSVVIDRVFELTLQTDFKPEQAVAKIVEHAVATGKIMDTSGRFDDTDAIYHYQYLYVTNINEIGDFYVIAEVLEDAQGVSSRTGNYYAVNVYTGYYYKLQIENGIYTLSELN